jgi:hypothetical protein
LWYFFLANLVAGDTGWRSGDAPGTQKAEIKTRRALRHQRLRIENTSAKLEAPRHARKVRKRPWAR